MASSNHVSPAPTCTYEEDCKNEQEKEEPKFDEGVIRRVGQCTDVQAQEENAEDTAVQPSAQPTILPAWHLSNSWADLYRYPPENLQAQIWLNHANDYGKA